MNSNQIQILVLIAAILVFLSLLYWVVSSFADENNRVFVYFLVLIVVIVGLFLLAYPLLRQCNQPWCQQMLFLLPKF